MKNCYFLIVLIFFIVSSCKKQPDALDKKNNNKPEVGFEYPSDFTTFKVGDTVKVVANTFDEDGTVTKVLFYQNDQLFFVDSVKPWEQKIVFNKAQLVKLQLKAYDNDNNFSESPSININIVNSTPFYADIYREPSWQLYENDSVKFTVIPNVYDTKIVKTEFYLNNQLYETDTLSPFVFYIDSIAAGDYTYYFILEDDKGKTGRTSNYTIEVRPNLPPNVSMNSPVSGSEYYAGQHVQIDVYSFVNNGHIKKTEILVNDSVIYSEDDGNIFTRWVPKKQGEYKISARVYDSKNMIGYSDTVTVTVKPSFVVAGVISDLTYSENDNLVFGINQTTNQLLLINPYTLEVNKVDLPYSQPVAFDYSLSDKKLYIVYKFTGVISVWDNNTQSLSSINFSDTHDGRDISVDEINRRIYVISNAGFYILDMDNGNTLNYNSSLEGKSIVVDPVDRWVFTNGGSSYSPVSLLKYSVANDFFNLIEANSDLGWNIGKIAICPDFNFVILPSGGSNATLYAYDTQNIINILGEFNVGTYPSFATFSPDGSTLFGLNGDSYDNNIYVMRTNGFTLKQKIPLPRADEYAVLTTNHAADKIVAFTCKEGSDNTRVLYFIDLN